MLPSDNYTSLRDIRVWQRRWRFTSYRIWMIYILLSRYKFLLITNLTHFFMYLFISSPYMFPASRSSSSEDRIVLIHHLLWLVCVNDCLVCRLGGNCSSLLQFPSDRHTKQQHVERWKNKHMKKCVKLVISKNSQRDARSTKYKIYSESLAWKNPRKKTGIVWDDNLKRSQTLKKLVWKG